MRMNPVVVPGTIQTDDSGGIRAQAHCVRRTMRASVKNDEKEER